MKKNRIFAAFLSLFMILSVSGCAGGNTSDSSSNSSENGIASLLDQGYTCTMSSAEENQWKGVFQKEDSFDSVIKAVAAITDAQYEEYDAISFDDDQADAKTEAFLRSLEDVTVTDITGLIPSQEELDTYVGKTLGDLEQAGFENTGNTNLDGTYTFFYDGPVYCCKVDLKEGTVIEDMDDYSANDLKALEIGAMEFSGFSFGVLDQE